MRVDMVTMVMPKGNRLTPVSREENNSGKFSELLLNALNKVNDLQRAADEDSKKLVLGETDDIHRVMLSAEEAKLALQLTVQIRNKVVEAYQEISRMQF